MSAEIKKVFISHTSGRSTDFSKSLVDWIESSPISSVLHPWHSGSQDSLSIGSYPHARIISAAASCSYCISVITKENINEPWLNFEAGLFFSKSSVNDINLKPIVTLLCGDFTYKDIPASHPLQPIFSVKASDRGALKSLLLALYRFSGADVKDHVLEKFIGSNITDDFLSAHDNVFSLHSNKIIDAKRGLFL